MPYLVSPRPTWAPTAADWWQAGLLIRKVGDAQHWDTNKRRAFQNDVLVALTARRYGATIVTANHDDFELLRKELAVALLLV
jgi:predicted nucleic acid-binding protein